MSVRLIVLDNHLSERVGGDVMVAQSFKLFGHILYGPRGQFYGSRKPDLHYVYSITAQITKEHFDPLISLNCFNMQNINCSRKLLKEMKGFKCSLNFFEQYTAISVRSADPIDLMQGI